jgi:outer membrane protein assembly factor BamA
LKRTSAKISFIIVIALLFYACNSIKRVPKGKNLLVKSELIVDGKTVNTEEITNLIAQKPNTQILKLPFSLYVYNLAEPNPDSLYYENHIKDTVKFKRLSKFLSEKQVYRLGKSFWYSGIHKFLKNTGESPVILDENRTKKSLYKLQSYYFNEGYFNVKANSKTDTVGEKKVKSTYTITLGKPYIVDSITRKIESPALDSLYKITEKNSLIIKGELYNSGKFEEERNRLTVFFRNNGVYNFQQNYINYDIDTISTGNKANVNILISNYSYRSGDTLISKPFEVFKISEVNIYTDNPNAKKNVILSDTITYNNFNIYSSSKFKYKPKAITDAIFITKGSVYSDLKNNLTSRSLSNFRIFNYPSILYEVNKKDSLSNTLISNIYLSPRKKYTLAPSVDLTHSDIQDFGITGNLSLGIRNVFNGAETFDISARGNIGSSQDIANPNDQFFNISEIGLDAKLSFPRILFPFKTDKIIPKNMLPSTQISGGFAKQKNIGLDKENLTAAFNYKWTPKRNNSLSFDFVNIQYVKNINVSNYFNVYQSSYDALNSVSKNYDVNSLYYDTNGNLIIESGTNGFLNDVLGENPSIFPTPDDLSEINNIDDRKRRLTENNLIVASSFNYSTSSKKGILDNDFLVFRTKLESAGNILDLVSGASNQPLGPNGNKTIFDVEYSQYIKTEIEFIKHFEFRKNSVIASRVFIGMAIPYGNSQNIPFSRSYFAGGSNDNRAWQPYSLGPGSSNAQNDFNDANLKIAFNTEYRFKIIGKIRGALFVDVGNIWNFLDNIDVPGAQFTGLDSLKDIAVGSGFGIRYDFGFVIARFDFGFKTYNPANNSGDRWFTDYNFSNSVFNVGINYPF